MFTLFKPPDSVGTVQTVGVGILGKALSFTYELSFLFFSFFLL